MEIEKEIYEIIDRLQDIKHKQSMLSTEENDLSTPRMEDMSKIDKIYRIFCEFESEEGVLPLRQKKFLFVVLYFYSPAALAGNKMRRGLREKVASVVGCTSSNVSHDYKNIPFYYLNYKNFRYDCNELIKYISERV